MPHARCQRWGGVMYSSLEVGIGYHRAGPIPIRNQVSPVHLFRRRVPAIPGDGFRYISKQGVEFCGCTSAIVETTNRGKDRIAGEKGIGHSSGSAASRTLVPWNYSMKLVWRFRSPHYSF